MPCKTKSYQSAREKFRMLRALLPDTPRPPQFQPELPKIGMYWYVLAFLVNYMLGGTVDHQKSVLGQLGPPRTILEVFDAQVTLQEFPTS